MSWMIRYKRRGTDTWKSVLEELQVREFLTEEEVHNFKEKLELQYSTTHTYNVYEYDASAL